jgi:hypothetical protein
MLTVSLVGSLEAITSLFTLHLDPEVKTERVWENAVSAINK